MLDAPSSIEPEAPSPAFGIGHNALRAVTMTPVGAIKQLAKSTRMYNRTERRRLARFMKRFVHNVPIGVDEDGYAIVGEAFLIGAQEAGLSSVATFAVSSLGELEREALAASYSNAAQQGAFDMIKLGSLFQQLEVAKIDAIDLGFEVPQIDLAFAALSAGPVEKESTETAPADGPATAKIDDVFLLGQHRLICGDALDEAVVQRVMAGKVATAMFTDPPYNVPIEGFVSSSGRHREFPMATGEMTNRQFAQFLQQVAKVAIAVSRDGALHFICMDWRHIEELMSVCAEYGAFINLCVWAKQQPGMGSYLRSQHELIFIFRVGDAAHTNNVQLGKHGRNRSNLWSYPSASTFNKQEEDGRFSRAHATPKPVKMVTDALLDCTARGDVVLDLFIGSGTTIMAADRIGRICHGVELDPLHVDLAVRRWEAWTGEVAVHEETGLSFSELGARRVEEASHEG